MHSTRSFPRPAFFSSLALLLAIAAGSAACGGGGGSGSGSSSTGGGTGGGNSAGHGSVFVGVTSEFRVGIDIDRLRVRRWIGDELASDTTLTANGGDAKLTLPATFPFEDIKGGETVTIQLDAFEPTEGQWPITSRLASTKVLGGAKLLLRARLDTRCNSSPFSSKTTICAAPDTCIAGACAPSFVDPQGLPAYDPSWSADRNDVCKPIGGGAPVVTVGEGQSDYLPTHDLDVAQLEAGPQGGHHVWVAIRMKNLLQSGSLTKVSGEVPELGLAIRPFQVIFTFDQDEGGFCKLYGLRFQVDQERDVHDLLGKVLKIKAEVTDKDGDVGVGERTVTLSSTIL